MKRANPRAQQQLSVIDSLFYNSQFNTTTHEKLIKQMRQEYDKTPLHDFFKSFASCLVILFKVGEKHASVERTLDFAAKFSVSLYSQETSKENSAVEEEEEEEEEMPEFLKNLFDWLFASHQNKDQSVRFRVCQFINKLLHNLGEEASLDDILCDKIGSNMMERLQDKVPAVRAQAVMALQRLQDPTSPDCPIIKAYLFHLGADPSTSVRRSVLTCIGRTNITLPHILERTRDIKDTVRRHAYVVITKLNIRSLTIKQRERLLREGLKDRSEIVSNFVATVLLPGWLRSMKGNYLELLHALDVENSTETSILALKRLFKHRPMTELMDSITSQQTDKLIPLDKLTPENALFWRCLAQYLHDEGGEELTDNLDKVIPDLTPYCEYIKSYYLKDTPSENSSTWYQIQRQFVVHQLLELAKVFDLADEMGRSNLKRLIFDLLTCTHVKEGLVSVIVELLVNVDPNVNSRLQFLAEIVSEVHEPMTQISVEPSSEEIRKKQIMQAKIKVRLNEIREEQETAVRDQDFVRAQTLVEKIRELQEEFQKLSAEPEVVHKEVRTERNDRATLSKCLSIIYEMMQSPTVTKLTPHLRSLMENFVMLYIEDCDNYVRSLALRDIGVFCLLDQELAKQYMLMFYYQLANNETDEVCIMALKVIFDIFHLYGLQPFQMEDDEGEKEADKTGKKKLYDTTDLEEDDDDDIGTTNSQSTMNGSSSNFITILTSLLDSTSADMRTVAAEGLCKLLLANRIKSPNLVSRLLIMWYNPVTEGDIFLRQMLAAFFTNFASHCSWGQETLEQAFLPTLRTLFSAPHTSPLVEVDQDSMVRLLLNLTRPGINPQATQCNVHNNLAIAICNEVLVDQDPYNIQVLIRALAQLDLILDDPIVVQSIRTLAEKLAEVVKEKNCLRHIRKFQHMLAGAERTSVETTSEVTGTASVMTSDQQTVDNTEVSTVNEPMETDDEDSDDTLEPSTPYPGSGRRIIPETPDNSDSPVSLKSADTASSGISQLDGEARMQSPRSKSSQLRKSGRNRSPDKYSSGDTEAKTPAPVSTSKSKKGVNTETKTLATNSTASKSKKGEPEPSKSTNTKSSKKSRRNIEKQLQTSGTESTGTRRSERNTGDTVEVQVRSANTKSSKSSHRSAKTPIQPSRNESANTRRSGRHADSSPTQDSEANSVRSRDSSKTSQNSRETHVPTPRTESSNIRSSTRLATPAGETQVRSTNKNTSQKSNKSSVQTPRTESANSRRSGRHADSTPTQEVQSKSTKNTDSSETSQHISKNSVQTPNMRRSGRHTDSSPTEVQAKSGNKNSSNSSQSSSETPVQTSRTESADTRRSSRHSDISPSRVQAKSSNKSSQSSSKTPVQTPRLESANTRRSGRHTESTPTQAVQAKSSNKNSSKSSQSSNESPVHTRTGSADTRRSGRHTDSSPIPVQAKSSNKNSSKSSQSSKETPVHTSRMESANTRSGRLAANTPVQQAHIGSGDIKSNKKVKLDIETQKQTPSSRRSEHHASGTPAQEVQAQIPATQPSNIRKSGRLTANDTPTREATVQTPRTEPPNLRRTIRVAKRRSK